MSQQNPYAPPNAEVADVVNQQEAPALWNPFAAASWSLLFSPIFGAFLHMRNWEALGQPDKAAKSKAWVIGGVVFFAVMALAPFLFRNSSALEALGRFGGFVLLIAWYYSIGKSQQAFVTGHFGKSYPRRGWLKPILAAIGLLFAFFAVLFLVGLVLGAVSGAA